jgi:Holliday junction resolvase-like predicted endonuclease
MSANYQDSKPMLIDFTEVTDHQDWERFAMEFLQLQGLQIVQRCAVGPDGGVDFIAAANVGFGGTYRWLVSCKLRGSGTVGIGGDAADDHKLREFGCNGFMFVYSRPLTSGLLASFHRVKANTNAGLHIFTDREIESALVGNPAFYLLIRQYFPLSWQRLAPALQINDCDCGHAMGNIYLLPYTDPQTMQVMHQRCCDYCGSSVTSGLEDANIVYGQAILIHANE